MRFTPSLRSTRRHEHVSQTSLSPMRLGTSQGGLEADCCREAAWVHAGECATQDAQVELHGLTAVGAQKRDVVAVRHLGQHGGGEVARDEEAPRLRRAGRHPGHVASRSIGPVLDRRPQHGHPVPRTGASRCARFSDGIDPSTSTRRLVLDLLASLAEYERELTAERLNAGIAASRQRQLDVARVERWCRVRALSRSATRCASRWTSPRGI